MSAEDGQDERFGVEFKVFVDDGKGGIDCHPPQISKPRVGNYLISDKKKGALGLQIYG